MMNLTGVDCTLLRTENDACVCVCVCALRHQHTHTHHRYYRLHSQRRGHCLCVWQWTTEFFELTVSAGCEGQASMSCPLASRGVHCANCQAVYCCCIHPHHITTSTNVNVPTTSSNVPPHSCTIRQRWKINNPNHSSVACSSLPFSAVLITTVTFDSIKCSLICLKRLNLLLAVAGFNSCDRFWEAVQISATTSAPQLQVVLCFAITAVFSFLFPSATIVAQLWPSSVPPKRWAVVQSLSSSPSVR